MAAPIAPGKKPYKRYLTWAIWGTTAYFLGATLIHHGRAVADLAWDRLPWINLLLALVFTLGAHTWAGWVWIRLAALFGQHLPPRVGIPLYLRTNLAKYLPGNVWHFYGRLNMLQQQGSPLAIATAIVLLEPLLMAIAAALIALSSYGTLRHPLLALAPLGGLVAIHPAILNPLLMRLQKNDGAIAPLRTYPLGPLLGEILFLLGRGSGFLWVAAGFLPNIWGDLPQWLSHFAAAWLFGLLLPGAPGGIGVFEATLIALTPETQHAPLVAILALFRLISLGAEVCAAGPWWGKEILPEQKS